MKKILFFTLLFFTLVLTSCKNFLSGNEFLEELQDTIDYLSAPFTNVSITADNQATKSITPAIGNYSEKYKKGDKIFLSFEETEQYQFTNWSVEPSEAVIFDAETSKTAEATIQTEAAQISISPKVFKRPVCTVSPSNLIISPKNTSVVISFDHQMEITDELLQTIDIQIEGISILDSFNKNPSISNIDGKTLITFIPDRKKLVTVDKASAIVDIIIPAGFYYKVDNKYNITLDKEVLYSYKINNETLDKAEITVFCPPESGTLSYSGTKTYYLDNSITVSCTPTQEWEVSGWKATYEDGSEVLPNILELKKVNENDNSTIIATLLTGSNNPITLQPICKPSNYIMAYFTSNNGYISPIEPKKLYSNKELDISFRPDSDFSFVNWKVLNYEDDAPLSKEEISSILEMNSNMMETKITTKYLTKNYTLKFVAACGERAQILSTAPLYSGEGTYRDSRVMVMFDHAMSKDSIYFTSDEIAAIKAEKKLSNNDFVPGIADDINTYGYVYNGELYYKNISIIDYKTNKNLLDHFGAPYFESTTVLTIPTKKGNAPIGGTQIFVTIDSSFFYEQDNKPITLAGAKKWNYLVNSKEDSTPPIFETSNYFSTNDIPNTSTDKKLYNLNKLQNGTIYNIMGGFSDEDAQSKLSYYYSKPNSLNLYLELTDTGSGASSVTMYVKNVENNKTAEVSIPIKEDGTNVYYRNDKEDKAKEINLYDYVDFSLEGTNIVYFIGKDKNDNSTTSNYYYFYSDTKAPSWNASTPISVSSDDKTLNLSWIKPEEEDSNKFIFKYKKSEETEYGEPIECNNTDESYILESLDEGTTYEIIAWLTDIWGNKSTEEKRIKSTKPGVPTFTTVLQKEIETTSIPLDWNKPSGNYNGARLVYTAKSDKEDDIIIPVDITDNSITSYTVENLIRGKKYLFELSSVDNEKNYSSNVAKVETIIKPDCVKNLRCSEFNTGKIVLNWEKPEDYYSGIYVSYAKYSETIKEEDWIVEKIPKDSITKTFINLTSDTKYSFKIESYSLIDGKEVKGNPITFEQSTKTFPLKGLCIDSTTTTSIKLAWSKSNFASLKITINTVPATTEKSYTVTDDTLLNYTIPELTAGTNYTISIISTGESGTSDPADIDAITNPNKLSSLTAEGINATSSKVSFVGPSDGKYENVKVYYSTNSSVPVSTSSYTSVNKGTNSVTITGLQPGTKYYYKAVTQTGSGSSSSEGITTSCVTNPAAITSATVSTAVSSSNTALREVTVSWTSPTAESYDKVRIYYGLSSTSTTYVDVTKGTNAKVIDRLTAGKTYCCRLVTVKTIDNTDYYSTEKTVNITTTPNNLSSLTAETVSTTAIKLSWSYPSSGGYSGVYIYRKLSTASAYTLITTLTSSSTSWQNNSLSTGKIYDYKVIPYVSGDTGSVLSTTNKTIRKATKPAAVTSMSISGSTLSWAASSGSITGATVYRRPYSSTEDWTDLGQTTSTSISISTSDLTAGEQYIYKVVPYLYETSNTGAENTTSYNIQPNTVTKLEANSATSSSIKLSWTEASGYASKYEIYYKKNSASSYSLYTSTTGTSCTISSLSGATKYNFYVRTIGRANTNFISSSPVIWYTLPSKPTNFKVLCDDGQGRIKIQWTQPTGDAFDDVDLFVGSTSIGTFSNTAGSTVTTYVDIPSFSRSNTFTIKLQPYIKQYNGTWGHSTSDDYSYTYYNSTGNIMINGTTYSKSNLNNVITTSTSINANTSHTDGAFTTNRYVTLNPYSIGAYEVTNALYYAVTGTKPSGKNTGDLYPVENMNWYQACWFCNKLSNLMGLTPVYKINGYDIAINYCTSYSSIPTSSNDTWNKMTYDMSANGYRLPTEAEWEFAARGGSTSLSSWGFDYSGSNSRDNVAWSNTNANSTTHEVGTKSPNRLSLYDMSGNVWEWLTDWNNDVPNGTFINPYCDFNGTCSYYYNGSNKKFTKKEGKILQKGGSWNNDTDCKVDYNSAKESPETHDNKTGLRIMRRKTIN